MKVRQDAWSHEDDLLLAETVLRHVREGSTQLNAFEEVGDKLNRTAAACGFRWNAEVRDKYEQAMQLAKKQRKQRKRALALQSQQFKLSEIEHDETYEVYSSQQAEEDNMEDETETTATSQLEFSNEITLDSVLRYLQALKRKGVNTHTIRSENERLARENRTLVEEKNKLVKRLKHLQQQTTMIQEDYQSLVQIMDRARRLVMNEDNRDLPAMPVNEESTIEQIAK